MARFGKLGWFLGLIFGTLFGVLYAPRKGRELRDRIKADRKKGRLGIAPLQSDLKSLGSELASLARDIYKLDIVQDIVVKGRKQMKQLSDDFVGDIADFHVTRIRPLQKKVSSKIVKGKKVVRNAKKEWNTLQKKMEDSASVGRKAIKRVKSIFKKKPL